MLVHPAFILLDLFGPVPQRIVEARNRITTGGVTAGIDFGGYFYP